MPVNMPEKKRGMFEATAAPMGQMIGTAVGGYFGGPAGAAVGGQIGQMAGQEAAGKEKGINQPGQSTAMQRRQEKIVEENKKNQGKNYAGYDASEKV